jgi:hypothetical protein
MNPSNRKRFRARLAILEAKEAERSLQRRKSEERKKYSDRIDSLKSKPEFELTPRELLELEENRRQDPIYPALKAWSRVLREDQLEERNK